MAKDHKKLRAERKARWKDVQENGAGAYEPKKWQREPKTRVRAIEGLNPNIARAFAAAMGVIRPGGR